MKKFIALLMGVALVSPFAVGCDKKTTGTKTEKVETKPDGTQKTTTQENKMTSDVDKDGEGTVKKETSTTVNVDK